MKLTKNQIIDKDEDKIVVTNTQSEEVFDMEELFKIEYLGYHDLAWAICRKTIAKYGSI